MLAIGAVGIALPETPNRINQVGLIACASRSSTIQETLVDVGPDLGFFHQEMMEGMGQVGDISISIHDRRHTLEAVVVADNGVRDGMEEDYGIVKDGGIGSTSRDSSRPISLIESNLGI